MRECYLVMVTPANNNKFYKMTDKDDGTLYVEYGRIGVSSQKTTYNISLWDRKYNEKIRKGYTDVTALHQTVQPATIADEDEGEYAEIPDEEIRKLVDYLMSMARQTISRNYTVASEAVTQEMVDKAQALVDSLVTVKDVRLFNDILLELFAVIPRRMGNVQDHMASVAKDFESIINHEQQLLDVMRGQVVAPAPKNKKKSTKKGAKTILEAMGLEIKPVGEADVKLIKRELGQCASMYYKAWKVVNKKTQKSFNEFLEANGKRLKKLYLWHGSRTENWWSILNTGLVLRPTNAVISGKMFGYGIYFANKAMKSLGYTSMRGSRWAGGSSNHAFMALFHVVYGKPYNITHWQPRHSGLDYKALKNLDPDANCVHAHGGADLVNDEIIVYREEQLTIKYLVELKR